MGFSGSFVGHQFTALPIEVSGFTVHGHHTAHGNQPVLLSVFQVAKLALDECNLLVIGNFLGLKVADLLRQLIAFRGELLLLALMVMSLDVNSFICPTMMAARSGSCAGTELGWAGAFRGLVALGLKARTHCQRLIKQSADGGKLGFGFRVIQDHWVLARFDTVTIPDTKFCNDAAVLVLHLLGEGVHRDSGGCDDGTVQLSKNRAAADRTQHEFRPWTVSASGASKLPDPWRQIQLLPSHNAGSKPRFSN